MKTAIRDPRARFYLPPTRIVWQTNSDATPANPDHLLTGHGPGQASVWYTQACRLEHHGKNQPGILLDFGREIYGGIEIVVGNTSGGKGVPIRVRFGESVSEAMTAPRNDHGIHDTGEAFMIPWAGAVEVGSTGFRFVRIDLPQAETWIDLLSIRAVALLRDVPQLGSFDCSDERLNKIWSVGAYTVHLCMQNYIWDGIKRDRLVWMGDMHPESIVVSTVFGENPVIPDSMDFARSEAPAPKWMNNMTPYSFWWVITQRDWFLYHGKLAYLQQQRDYLKTLIPQMVELVDADGHEKIATARFLDWTTAGKPEAVDAGLHALLMLALNAAADLCEVLGDLDLVEVCRATAQRMAAHKPDPGSSKQSAAIMVLAGLADAQTMNQRVLAHHPLEKLSTFYGYYVLQARAAAGDYRGAMETIRQYWGAMLDLGATTFWEHFDIDWLSDKPTRIDQMPVPGRKDIHADFGEHCYVGLRHSLCHGWAAGPTAWLSEHVLGIKPLKPGFAQVLIQPNLGDLNWARGTFPTPKGLITVEHRKNAAGIVESTIDVPAGVEVVRPAKEQPREPALV